MRLESWARQNISEFRDMPEAELRAIISRSRRGTGWVRLVIGAILVAAVIAVFPVNRVLPLRYGDLWNALVTGALVGLAVIGILLPVDIWERQRLRKFVSRELRR